MNGAHEPTGDEQRDSELLVAYLDGEVSDAERQGLERRLASDAALREQLAGLQKSWHMLDRLSTAHADDAFTRTTISMAVQSARETAEAPPVPPRRRAQQIAVIALAALLGFLAIRLPWRAARNRQLEDLPVANHLDLYRYADSVEFLRQLDQSNLFGEESDDGL